MAADVGQLVWAAQGITAEGYLRTAPSAGALYPLETYLVVGEIEGIAPGLYHYRPERHDLVLTKSGDLRRELALAAIGQDCVRDGAVTILFAAVYARTSGKYGERAMRYVHMEAARSPEYLPSGDCPRARSRHCRRFPRRDGQGDARAAAGRGTDLPHAGRQKVAVRVGAMQDTECIAFLRWALPKLHMRWPGFRKVRHQVCKRVGRRLTILGLSGTSAYKSYLETHPEEWTCLDQLCWVSISRFSRDRAVFERLTTKELPSIVEGAGARGSPRIRAWSAGCCAGEKPYTLMLLWRFLLQPRFPGLELSILATDIDCEQLKRAHAACYPRGSVKELPATWIESAFEKYKGRFSLRPEFRTGVEFRQQDVRKELPDGPFDLVLCRNLVFTYFEDSLQTEITGARWRSPLSRS
jgi:chemotaxis protein methyltransferase CheR